MAISYNIVDIRGVAATPIIEELIFDNETVARGLVTFEDDVKAETIFTESSATAAMQAYTSGAPSSDGTLDAFDVPVTPIKYMYYQEFDPNTIRFSRFKRDMAPGAWNVLSNEFERVVIGGVYAKKMAADIENKFWNNALAGTKTAVATLTAGTDPDEVSTAEKALVAATTAGLWDGVVTRMIYNSSNATLTAGVGGRIKVAGTTITASTIKAEYDKLYAAIPAVVLNDANPATLYVPRSHKQLINTFNNNVANFKDAFAVSPDFKTYSFNGLMIEFVPIPENVMIAAKKEHIIWCTDLASDQQLMKIDKIAANREDMFIKSIMTTVPHIVNQSFNVLYVG